MTLSKQQATLYEAVSNIDSKYIEETVTAPIRFTPGIVKRIAAVAAVLALIICLGFFAHPHGQTPYLTLQANAVSSANAQCIPIDYNANNTPEWIMAAPPYRPPTHWGDHKLFHFGIFINNISKEYCDIKTDLEILYENGQLEYLYKPSYLNNALRTYSIYGWTAEDTTITLNMYVYKGTERILFQSQTVLITVNGGYALEILASEINEDIEWSELS